MPAGNDLATPAISRDSYVKPASATLRRMHEFLFDHQRRVLLVRLPPRFDSAAVEELQAAGQNFIQHQGRVDSILDFSQVEEIAVPIETLANRGQERPLMGDHLRVYVMPRDDIHSLGSMFASNQRLSGNRAPVVVRSMDEAYATLTVRTAVPASRAVGRTARPAPWEQGGPGRRFGCRAEQPRRSDFRCSW